MRQNKSRKGQQESMEAREEANLKDELDEDTKKKQALELKDEVNHQDLKGLLSMDKEADSAKHLKVSSGKGALKASADAREEAALRSKLNAEVKAKQQQLFTQGESSVVMKGGVHSIARARALDGKQKLSEAQLEAQLRASLNAKVPHRTPLLPMPEPFLPLRKSLAKRRAREGELSGALGHTHASHQGSRST